MDLQQDFIFEKKINYQFSFKFAYVSDSIRKEYRWTSLLYNNKKGEPVPELIEKFTYNFNSLPIKKTPDVWENTIYKLFSVLDVLSLRDDEFLILYDKFGEVYIDRLQFREKTHFVIPIRKYKMSFLWGYEAGYGKMIKVENNIYTCYSAASPPRDNFIKFSLQTNAVTEIFFPDEVLTIEEDDPSFISLINQEQEDTNELSKNLSKLTKKIYGIEKEMVYLGKMKDMRASYPDSRNVGEIYFFIKIDGKLSIFIYDRYEQKWLISDFEEKIIE